MKNIITIGREYGSGGREIGKRLSELLNIPYYDKEIISVASKESGIAEEIFYQNDEQHGSMIYSLMMGNYSMVSNFNNEMPIFQKVFLAQFDAINKIADKGPCIIVGRCADYVLKDRNNTINVFINADNEAKIKRVSERRGINEKAAADRIKKTDKKRAQYYNFNTNMKWGIAGNYDTCIKSSKLGIEKTAQLLKTYIDFLEKE